MMPSPPRLVASDLDGTLLRSDGSVGDLTAQVWAALAELGVATVLVTARPPRWLDHLADLVGGHGLAICGNGAFVYDVAARKVIDAMGFTPVQARAVIADVLEAFPGAGAAVETDRGMFHSAAYPDAQGAQGDAPQLVTECELVDLADDLVIGKILVRDQSWAADEFVEDVQAVIGTRGKLAYSGAKGLAEICAPGLTKASRLAAWCQQQGIARADVWAFGDMPNDIPMITWAGRGHAVGAAHPDLVAVADAGCGSNDEDGVARALLDGVPGLAELVGRGP